MAKPGRRTNFCPACLLPFWAFKNYFWSCSWITTRLFCQWQSHGLMLFNFHKKRIYTISWGFTLFKKKSFCSSCWRFYLSKYKAKEVQGAVLCARYTNQDSFALFHSVTKDKRSLQGVGGVDWELLLFSESWILFVIFKEVLRNLKSYCQKRMK